MTIEQAMRLKKAGFPQDKEIALHFNKHGPYADYECAVKCSEKGIDMLSETYSAPTEKEMIVWLSGRTDQFQIKFSDNEWYVIANGWSMVRYHADLTETLVQAVEQVAKAKGEGV